jgi:hypothetical protein
MVVIIFRNKYIYFFDILIVILDFYSNEEDGVAKFLLQSKLHL